MVQHAPPPPIHSEKPDSADSKNVTVDINLNSESDSNLSYENIIQNIIHKESHKEEKDLDDHKIMQHLYILEKEFYDKSRDHPMNYFLQTTIPSGEDIAYDSPHSDLETQEI